MSRRHACFTHLLSRLRAQRPVTSCPPAIKTPQSTIISVSKTNNPLGGWLHYYIDGSPSGPLSCNGAVCLPDYPQFAIYNGYLVLANRCAHRLRQMSWHGGGRRGCQLIAWWMGWECASAKPACTVVRMGPQHIEASRTRAAAAANKLLLAWADGVVACFQAVIPGASAHPPALSVPPPPLLPAPDAASSQAKMMKATQRRRSAGSMGEAARRFRP